MATTQATILVRLYAHDVDSWPSATADGTEYPLDQRFLKHIGHSLSNFWEREWRESRRQAEAYRTFVELIGQLTFVPNHQYEYPERHEHRRVFV
jgi:hypothetical protein